MDLTSKDRKALPKKDFGLPKTDGYPMEDREHAALAKARASEEVKKGNLTSAQQKEIDYKADQKLKGR
jgi:hypothetical protein